MADTHCRGSSDRQLVDAAARLQWRAVEEAEAVAAGYADVLVEEAGREAR